MIVRNTKSFDEEAVRIIQSFSNKSPQKQLEEYENAFSQITEFFTTYNPDLIEKILVAYLGNKQVDVKTSSKKYKFQYTVESTGTDGSTNEIGILVRILKVANSQ